MGFEPMQDVALGRELCLRVDLGVSSGVVGQIPDGFEPWGSLEDCLLESSQGYERTGLFFVFLFFVFCFLFFVFCFLFFVVVGERGG